MFAPSASSLLDGKYRLVRELSRGGMGTVFVATHEHLGTEVAVKLLHDGGDGGGPVAGAAARRFLREAQLAAQLRHPQIVQVLDFGVAQGVPYLVMELVPGHSLRQELSRRGQLSMQETLDVVDGVAAALAAAHQRHIVHRDLKPENILLRAEPSGRGAAQIKVIDFGLATLVAGMEDPREADGAALRSPELAAAPAASGSSAVPEMAGTPAYLSPEQASGLGPVTEAADLWALGVIAFECLTGQRPFPGESLGELVLQICAWAPPVPSQVAEVPVGFDAWFATACARAPADRFPSAPAMAAALAGLARSSAPELPRANTAPESTRAALPPRPRRGWSRAARPAMLVGLGAALWLAAWSAGAFEAMPAPRAAIEPRVAQGRGEGAVATSAPRVTAGPPRVAVLPIDGELGPELASVPASLTDALITELSARTQGRLIAMASVARFPAGPARDLRAVIQQLAVQRVVVASLARDGEALQLAVELIDAEQTRLWSQRFTRPARELEQLCDDAARALAGQLGARVVAASAPRDPEAYRAYLSGRFFLARRDHASLVTAIEHFEQATARAPDYARAWVGLADSYLLLPWMGPTPRSSAHARARAALGRALLLDPDSSEAHAARGNQLLEIDWDFAGSEAAFRRAIALDPNNASAHQWLGELLMLSRRFDEAEAEMQQALELEPLGAAVHKNRAKVLYYARRYREAEAAWRKALELDPGQPWAQQGLGYTLAALGRFDEALAAVRAEPVFQPPAMAPFAAVQELWIAARREDAAELARTAAIVEAARLEQYAPWTVAFVQATLGHREPMLMALEQALRQRDPFTPLTAVSEAFDPYRADPRFGAIMLKLGL